MNLEICHEQLPLAGMTHARPAPAPAPKIRLHNATTADASTLALIYNEGLLATPLERQGLHAPLHLDAAVEWITLHQRVSRPLWIASVQGTPIAWLSFVGFSERLGCASTSELGIQVRHSWRQRGIGHELLTRAVAASPGLGFDRLVAAIDEDNKASLSLFRGHGFRPWGRYPGVMRSLGRQRDMVVLGRVLELAPSRR